MGLCASSLASDFVARERRRRRARWNGDCSQSCAGSRQSHFSTVGGAAETPSSLGAVKMEDIVVRGLPEAQDVGVLRARKTQAVAIAGSAKQRDAFAFFDDRPKLSAIDHSEVDAALSLEGLRTAVDDESDPVVGAADFALAAFAPMREPRSIEVVDGFSGEGQRSVVFLHQLAVVALVVEDNRGGFDFAPVMFGELFDGRG